MSMCRVHVAWTSFVETRSGHWGRKVPPMRALFCQGQQSCWGVVRLCAAWTRVSRCSCADLTALHSSKRK